MLMPLDVCNIVQGYLGSTCHQLEVSEHRLCKKMYAMVPCSIWIWEGTDAYFEMAALAHRLHELARRRFSAELWAEIEG